MELQTETVKTLKTSNKGLSFSLKLRSGQSLTSVTQQPEREGGQCPAHEHDQGCHKDVAFAPGSRGPWVPRRRPPPMPGIWRLQADAPGSRGGGRFQVHVLGFFRPARPPWGIRKERRGFISRPKNRINIDDFLLYRGPLRGREIPRRKDTLAQLFPDLSRRERPERLAAPVHRPFFRRR